MATCLMWLCCLSLIIQSSLIAQFNSIMNRNAVVIAYFPTVGINYTM